MEWCDRIVAIYCLVSGVGVVGFWVSRLAFHKVALNEALMRHHLAAECATGAGLLAGGIATFVDARAGVSVALVGTGLGLLVYAGLQSQPFYPNEPQIRLALWFTLASAVIVLLLRLTTL